MLTLTPEEEKKALLSMLGKLHISTDTDPALLRTVSDLVTEAFESKVAADVTSRNILTKLQTALGKHLQTAKDHQQPDHVEDGENELKDDTVADALEDDADEAPAKRPHSSSPSAEDTMMLGEPDAEGTVVGDGEIEETVVGHGRGGNERQDDSVVDSLLESEDEVMDDA